MTALIFALTPENVIIGMDSLSVKEEKKPHKYVTKLFPLPHLKGAICGTGSMDVLLDWFTDIQRSVIANDILFLNKVAQERLLEITAKYNYPSDFTSTIYHFGYQQVENRFVGFAFRSKNNFKPESLAYGLGIKPVDDELKRISVDLVNEKGLPECFIDLMEYQKLSDENKPIEDQVGIGGEIHTLYLNKLNQMMWTCYQFPDYLSKFYEMLTNDGVINL